MNREEEGGQEKVVAQKTARWGHVKYKLFEHDVNWAGAEAYCQNESGRLTIILTEEDQQELTLAWDGNVWLGATDQEDEGVWKGFDGSLLNYTNWHGWQSSYNAKE